MCIHVLLAFSLVCMNIQNIPMRVFLFRIFFLLLNMKINIKDMIIIISYIWMKPEVYTQLEWQEYYPHLSISSKTLCSSSMGWLLLCIVYPICLTYILSQNNKYKEKHLSYAEFLENLVCIENHINRTICRYLWFLGHPVIDKCNPLVNNYTGWHIVAISFHALVHIKINWF